MSSHRPAHGLPFSEALRVWLKVAALSFGGPAGQIAVMHRIVVDEKRWIGEKRFLHALNYCMLLPGPEAQQLATYLGWLLHGWRGGLAAGGLFVLPGFLSILALSMVYAGFQGTLVITAIFFGLKPAVMAIVVEALVRIGRRALKSAFMISLALGAFVAMFFFDVPFPVIIVAAAVLGTLGGRLRPEWLGHGAAPSQEASTDAAPPLLADDALVHVRPSLRRALGVTALGLSIWWLPIAALAIALGASHVFVQEGVFFSKASVVTFGGAYAVLAYVAQEAVQTFGWLAPGEMLDGLGMAETTPGPLIMVVQFVGFMGAFRNPGTLDPMMAGVIGSVVVAWVTFVPCFLWIFLGAPYIERLRGNRGISNALAAITAAVVGVILNLAVWFSLHVLFGRVGETRVGPARLYVPDVATLDMAAAVIAAGAFLAMFRFKAGMIPTLAVSVLAGALWVWVGR